MTTVANPHAQPPQPDTDRTVITHCPACGEVGGPYDSPGDAEQAAGTHDDPTHRGEPTTFLLAEPVPAGAG